MAETDTFFKQSKLYNPHKHKPKIHVYGAGSIGSHVVIGLAKIGITDITVYDFDIVEESNIPAQFFAKRQAETKMFKTESIQYLTEYMTGIQIKTENIKIDEKFQPQISIDTIHILAFDNVEARRIIAEKIKDYPVYLIDGRIGGYNYEKYCLQATSPAYETYLKTLDGEFTELECGEKCLWVNNSLIASKIISDVIKLAQGKQPSPQVKGHALSDVVISGNL